MSPIDQAAVTAKAGRELLEASGDVIARRLEIVADALRDPLKADLREISLMGSEKVEALNASATAGMNGALTLAATGAAVAARETAAARGALDAVMGARHPAEAAMAQGAWAAAALSRAMTDGWSFGSTLLKLQADTLAPIHAAAVANAKRLKR
jgi:hypothetical protein